MATGNSSGKQDNRTRNWTFLVYPESAPENWRDILDDYHIPWVESPLHEFDLNADGTPKKAHYHIILQYGNKKSYEQVKEITDLLNQPIPKKVEDIRGMCRYLTHMDNPEKHQYSLSDIVCHSGMDIDEYLSFSKNDRDRMISEMLDFIQEHQVYEYCDFLYYCRMHRYDDWYKLLCETSYMVCKFLDSKRNKRKDAGFRTHGAGDQLPALGGVDPQTGEVLL